MNDETLFHPVRAFKRWTNSPVLDDPEELTLYRCTECGHVAHDLGTIHGHIEKHRPISRFWQMGDIGFLNRRTEVIEYELVSREIRDPLRESFRKLAAQMMDGFIDAFHATLIKGAYRERIRKGRGNGEALADAIEWERGGE